MGYDSIVPKCHTARFPFPSDGQVIGRVEMFAKEAESVDSLLALQFFDVDDKAWVIEKRLDASDGMSTNLKRSR